MVKKSVVFSPPAPGAARGGPGARPWPGVTPAATEDAQRACGAHPPRDPEGLGASRLARGARGTPGRVGDTSSTPPTAATQH
eukprot:2429622-Pyramimonas_sp.AAC.1